MSDDKPTTPPEKSPSPLTLPPPLAPLRPHVFASPTRIRTASPIKWEEGEGSPPLSDAPKRVKE